MAADPRPPSDPDLAALLVRVLGPACEPEFDAVTAALARISGCQLAFLSIVDGDTLWFKSSSAGPLPAIALEQSFCAGVVRGGVALAVPDMLADPAYRDHPLVAGEPFVRFYAGVPLIVQGQRIGTLCALDPAARSGGAGLLAPIGQLALVVQALVDARLAAAAAQANADQLALALASRDRLQRQLQQAERMAGIGSWRLGVPDGRLTYSDQVYAIHDLPPGDPGMLADALRFYPPPDRAVIERLVARAAEHGEGYDVELNFVTATGRQRRVRAMAEAEFADGRVTALVGVFQDVTQAYHQQQALEHAANTDALTQLGGRRGFNAHLDARLDAGGDALALVLADLDHFKAANDRHGHAAGDEVLRRVAAALRAPWLAGSYAARLGGDEFALVVTDLALLADLHAAADRLLAELVIGIGPAGDRVTVGATLGICCCRPGGTSRRALLECADAALYAAKNHRRGTACIRHLGFAAAHVA